MNVFQNRVAAWMLKCFTAKIAEDMTERGDRLLEEVLELLQSHDYDLDRAAPLVEYVRNRPKGEPFQEVGGVEVTLAAYCNAAKIDKQQAAFAELARIEDPKVTEKIRLKQQSKRDIHGPLP